MEFIFLGDRAHMYEEGNIVHKGCQFKNSGKLFYIGICLCWILSFESKLCKLVLALTSHCHEVYIPWRSRSSVELHTRKERLPTQGCQWKNSRRLFYVGIYSCWKLSCLEVLV